MAYIRTQGGAVNLEGLAPDKYLLATVATKTSGNIVTGSATYTSVSGDQGGIVFNLNSKYSTMTVNNLSAPVGALIHRDGTVTALTQLTSDVSDVDFVIASWGNSSTTTSFTFA